MYCGGVFHTRTHTVIGDIFLQVFHLHPRFCRLGHIFHAVRIHAIGNHRRHSVQYFQRNFLLVVIRHGYLSDQRSHLFTRQGIVVHLYGQFLLFIFLPYGQAVHTDFHFLFQIFIAKTLYVTSVFSKKRPKSGSFYILICHVRRVEFHNCTILIVNAEADNTLPAVDVVTPDWNAVKSRNTRQKTGKR